MMRSRSAFLLLLLAACTATDAPLEPGAGVRHGYTPEDRPGGSGPRLIIELEERADPAAVARDHGVIPEYVYTHALNGFAGPVSEAARAGLLRDYRVKRLHPDQVFATDETQTNATWGLDRIDQRSKSLDKAYTYVATGRGVKAYIVDTGIRYTHTEFGGRAWFGYDAFGGDGSDCAGHGTHVAGTVGGRTYGVAKEVELIAVRVLNCSGAGTTSTVVAGLNWIIANNSGPAVANLSLGGGKDDLIDAAIQRASDAGIAVAVAAGNSGADACNYSPARAPAAMTIGATGSTDARASFSNWGSCVDFFAPGVSITSAVVSSDASYGNKSGTSMSSPHAAGAAALYLSQKPGATAAEVSAALASWTTKGVVTSSNSANNDVLYTLGDVNAGDGTPNVPPAAAFGVSCAAGSCNFTDQSTDPDGTVGSWYWSFGDQATSALRNPAHAYITNGTYRVTLEVRDNSGAASSTWQDVEITDAPPLNAAPAASFSGTCTRLVCDFTDQSTDSDGTIAQRSWSFGDATTAAGEAASHTFALGGLYVVTLTVKDDDGAGATASRQFAVGPVLSLRGFKTKGRSAVELTWTGVPTTSVAIYLDGGLLATVENTGGYTYQSNARGQNTFTFRVCEAGVSSPMCSQHIAVTP